MNDRPQICVIEGATWSFDVELLDDLDQPYNLAGFIPSMQLRYQTIGAVIVDVVPADCVVDLQTGTVSANVPASKTSNITQRGAQNMLYGEFKLTSPSNVIKVPLAFSITPEFTR